VKKITLGENVQYIEYRAFCDCSGIDTIITEAIVPPHCDTLAFTLNSHAGYKNTPVIVPCGSMDEYVTASEWKKFGNLQEPVSEFMLTLQTEDEEKGSVAFDEPIDCVNTATVSATPKSGYSFVQWSDGNTDNPRTLTITDDITLIALFSTPTGVSDASFTDGARNGGTASKVFRDGQVYILRNGKTYTLIGEEVE